MIDLGSNAQLQLAERYYFAALTVDPSNGAPYNQLASMASAGSGADYGLEPAFFYLRGLNCGGKQFDGIEANFKSLLEKNEKAFDKYEALVSAGDGGGLPELSPARETERCAVYLLRLLRISLFGDVNTELSSTCKKALEALQHWYGRNFRISSAWVRLKLQSEFPACICLFKVGKSMAPSGKTCCLSRSPIRWYCFSSWPCRCLRTMVNL